MIRSIRITPEGSSALHHYNGDNLDVTLLEAFILTASIEEDLVNVIMRVRAEYPYEVSANLIGSKVLTLEKKGYVTLTRTFLAEDLQIDAAFEKAKREYPNLQGGPITSAWFKLGWQAAKKAK